MPPRPTRTAEQFPNVFSLEDAVISTLCAGQYYANVFAKLVKLATTIQEQLASNLDSRAVVSQLRTVAEEGRVELEVQLTQIQEFLSVFDSQSETPAACEDEIDVYAMEPLTTTKH